MDDSIGFIIIVVTVFIFRLTLGNLVTGRSWQKYLVRQNLAEYNSDKIF